MFLAYSVFLFYENPLAFHFYYVTYQECKDRYTLKQCSHSVHPLSFLLGVVVLPTKFSKTRGLRGPQFLEEDLTKNLVTFKRSDGVKDEKR